MAVIILIAVSLITTLLFFVKTTDSFLFKGREMCLSHELTFLIFICLISIIAD